MPAARGILRSEQNAVNPPPEVSIIFKIRVFYKARFEGFEFFIG